VMNLRIMGIQLWILWRVEAFGLEFYVYLGSRDLFVPGLRDWLRNGVEDILALNRDHCDIPL